MDFPCIVIPAYKPDNRLAELIGKLIAHDIKNIIIIDDGSGTEHKGIFDDAENMGCTVLRHAINMGKGRALKTGINYAMTKEIAEAGIITADADGQHTPEDIIKTADAMKENNGALVLGVRDFKGKIPLKSRFGNSITRRLFSFINGGDVKDTQTGLRGLPKKHLGLFLSLVGERYDYEMNMLLSAHPNAVKIAQIPIETIYIEKNRSSHFRAIIDSARIYKLIFKFLFSSLFATAIDYLIFFLMKILVPGQLILSVVSARVVSSTANYLINRHMVFKQKNAKKNAMLKYYILAGIIMFLNYGIIKVLSEVLGINVYLSKVITDISLYIVSFTVQREVVFKHRDG